jgi:putative ABC transport system permease protein
MRNTRFALRQLRRNPGFTTVAVLTFALGIVVTTTIFTVIYALMLAPLPYPEPDQLVRVWSTVQGRRNVSAAADYLDWKSKSSVFQGLHAFSSRNVNLTVGERPDQVSAGVVTPGFASTMGYPIFLGRDFLPEEGEPGKDQVAILTNRLWRERFGAARDLVGRQIRVDGKPRTVVGVLGPGVGDRLPTKLLVPMAFTTDQINHDFHHLFVQGRLKPGVSLAQANANLEVVARQVAEANPRTNKGWSAVAEPLRPGVMTSLANTGLWLVFAAVAFVLLIACANVANLLLARATSRQKEIAVRASLGATPGQLFRQLLTESLVLAGMGAAVGSALAFVFVRVLVASGRIPFPPEADVSVGVPVLLFTLTISMLCGVLFGSAPAVQAMRPNVTETLKTGGRSAGGGRHRLRRTLVIVEFALALTLLIGGAAALRALLSAARIDPGFRTEHLFTFSLTFASDTPRAADDINAFYSLVLDRISTVPGVTSASASYGIPVDGTRMGLPFHLAGQQIDDPSRRPVSGFNMVTPDYFRTFEIPVTRGRAITNDDRAGGPRVAMVNERFVERHLAGLDPLSQRLVIEQVMPGVTKLGPPVEWQIVGVYRNVRNGGLRDVYPEIDVPFWQSPWPNVSIVVRTERDLAGLQQSLAAALKPVDPDLPMIGVATMDQVIRGSLAMEMLNAAVFGTVAGLALLLAAVGIYGVMSFVVAQRTYEIGVRMALGAGRRRVLVQVLTEGTRVALAGVVLGLVGAWVLGRTMQSQVYGVEAMNAAVFGVPALTLLASGILACLMPAWRAMSVDPMTALRRE